MWAVGNGSNIRHFYGRGSTPIAICGHIGETKLDYTQVRLKKCPDCLRKFPRVEKEEE